MKFVERLRLPLGRWHGLALRDHRTEEWWINLGKRELEGSNYQENPRTDEH